MTTANDLLPTPVLDLEKKGGALLAQRGYATQRETLFLLNHLLDVESPPACHDLDSKRFENGRLVQLLPELAQQTLPRLPSCPKTGPPHNTFFYWPLRCDPSARAQLGKARILRYE